MTDQNTRSRIDLSQLSREQLERVILMQDQVIALMTVCNNALGARFEASEGRTAEQAQMFADWSTVINEIVACADADTRVIVFGDGTAH